MKKIFILFLFLFPAGIIAQSSDPSGYLGFLSEIYLYRQPSPRAEALGRGLVADKENDFGSFFNPALTSLSKGLIVNASVSDNYYLLDSAKFIYTGATYNSGKSGSLSFSRYHFNNGVTVADANDQGTNTIWTLNYSREVIKDLFAGVNLNLVSTHFPIDEIVIPGKVNNAYPLDFGILKRFSINNPGNKNLVQLFQIGSAIMNFNSAEAPLENEGYGEKLPVILRIGSSYNIKLKGNHLIENSNTVNLFTHIEYQKVINGDYLSTVKFGMDFTLFDLISLRGGYFHKTMNDRGFESNRNSQSEFTYGAGIILPLALITNGSAPLIMSLDFVSLKQPPFSNVIKDFENFSNFALKINYIQGM